MRKSVEIFERSGEPIKWLVDGEERVLYGYTGIDLPDEPELPPVPLSDMPIGLIKFNKD